jgi:hypothetical protein
MKFETALFIFAAAPAAAFTGLSAGGKLGFYGSCLYQSLGMYYLTFIAVSWQKDRSTSSLHEALIDASSVVPTSALCMVFILAAHSVIHYFFPPSQLISYPPWASDSH